MDWIAIDACLNNIQYCPAPVPAGYPICNAIDKLVETYPPLSVILGSPSVLFNNLSREAHPAITHGTTVEVTDRGAPIGTIKFTSLKWIIRRLGNWVTGRIWLPFWINMIYLSTAYFWHCGKIKYHKELARKRSILHVWLIIKFTVWRCFRTWDVQIVLVV